MRDVIIALAPAILVSVLFYGWSELLVLGVSVASCVLIEWAITKWLLHRPSTIADLSAVVTGLLLAMNLPATTPWWIVFIGALVAIGVAKMTFGGLGQNVFNPAITGRVFLLISFPTYMTDWTMPSGFMQSVDAVSGSTPLSALKEALLSGSSIPEFMDANGYTWSLVSAAQGYRWLRRRDFGNRAVAGFRLSAGPQGGQDMDTSEHLRDRGSDFADFQLD